MAQGKTRVKLTVNLGWQDAERYGLEGLSAEELLEGAIVQVAPDHATEFVNRHWGELAEEKREKTPRELVKPPREAAAG